MTLERVRERLFCNQKKCGQQRYLLIALTGSLWNLGLLSSALDVCRGERFAEVMRIEPRINTFLKPQKVIYWTVEGAWWGW